MLQFYFPGSRPAMTMLALAPSRIAFSSFNLRRSTPVLPIAIGRPNPSPHRPLPKEAINARRLHTAAAEIPIASDAPPRHTSRGSLPWRFAYAGPSARRATFMGPASANLHKNGPDCIKTLLPVHPDQRTSSDRPGMSQTCHQETHAPQQTASLFDHLVGAAKQGCRKFKTQ